MFVSASTWLAIIHFGLIQAAPIDGRSEAHVTSTPAIGGTKGYEFTDLFYTDEADHKRMASIIMSGCGPNEHVSEMLIGFRDNHSKTTEPDFLNSVHGSPESSETTAKLLLGKDEFINEIAAFTFGTGEDAMISQLQFWTNKGQKIACGTTKHGDSSYHFKPKDSALLHFSGRHDVALNSLQAHWIPVKDF